MAEETNPVDPVDPEELVPPSGEEAQVTGKQDTLEGVVIPPEELQIIAHGLKEMPNAVNKMASAVEVLTKTVRTSTTKAFTFVSQMIVAVALVGFFIYGMDQVRDTQEQVQRDQQIFLQNQEESTQRGTAIRDAVTKISECINYIFEEETNDCSRRLIAMSIAQNDQVRKTVNCAVQVGIREFFLQNSQVNVNPPTVSSDCQGQ